jgi:quinol monooxygenase YgiN
MVIVMGSFEMDPAERQEFLSSREPMMRTSRAEAGCEEYTFAADPLDPRRAVLTERWESQGHLDAHLAALDAGGSRPTTVTPSSSSIVIYPVAGEHRLM